jgi:hypothetical protein
MAGRKERDPAEDLLFELRRQLDEAINERLRTGSERSHAEVEGIRTSLNHARDRQKGGR